MIEKKWTFDEASTNCLSAQTWLGCQFIISWFENKYRICFYVQTCFYSLFCIDFHFNNLSCKIASIIWIFFFYILLTYLRWNNIFFFLVNGKLLEWEANGKLSVQMGFMMIISILCDVLHIIDCCVCLIFQLKNSSIAINERNSNGKCYNHCKLSQLNNFRYRKIWKEENEVDKKWNQMMHHIFWVHEFFFFFFVLFLRLSWNFMLITDFDLWFSNKLSAEWKCRRKEREIEGKKQEQK